MDEKSLYKVKISFPGNLEYVSPIRKFISEVLIVNNYSQKFAYRSEVIIDEVCSNAINYGCKSSDAHVELACMIFSDRIELHIKDQGGNTKDVERLRYAVNDTEKPVGSEVEMFKCPDC